MSSSRTSLSTSDQDSLSEALIEDDFNIGAFNADRSAEQALISVLGMTFHHFAKKFNF